MKVRIRFSKTGALVYIGHLDVMRYFQKLFVRADIPVAYSEGFSPHQLLGFSHPLPLGMESVGEYADIVLTRSMPTDEALARLRAGSVDEIGIYSFNELPEKCENAMAAVCASEYLVGFRDEKIHDIERLVSDLLEKNEINVIKKTKKSEKVVNIRPLIFDLHTEDDRLRMMISSGSVDNLKPELVINALMAPLEREFTSEELVMKRIDQYTSSPDGFVSLDMIGKKIDG